MSRVSVLAFLVAVLLTAGYAKVANLGPFAKDHDLVGTSADGSMSEAECRALLHKALDAVDDDETASANLIAIQGCEGAFDTDESEVTEPDEDAPVDLPEPAFDPLPPAVDGVRVLFDGLWTVVEGQWWIGNGETVMDDPDGPSYRRMFEAVGTSGAYLFVPGDDGRFHARVELLDAAPELPGWCEDAAEVSVRMDADPSPLQMGGFEEFTDPIGIPAGWYRLRYCTEKQDEADRQDPYAGDDYTTYVGRHLLQLWQEPRTPDRTLRSGSAFARRLAVR